jgi:protein arginine kinase activator
MTCQKCEQQATFHLSQALGDRVQELHLCDTCAREAGLIGSTPIASLQLEAVVKTLLSNQLGEQLGEQSRAACPCCRLKFMTFRSEGRLGCPHDYVAFASGLAPILRGFHGATRHVGKVIRSHRKLDARPLLKLRLRLRLAIEREEFERAAEIRDLLLASTRTRPDEY